MTVYYEIEAGKQFKLEIINEDEKHVDAILDQLNLGKFKLITADHFHIDDPMIINILDESNTCKIAELTFERKGLERLTALISTIE